MTPITARPSTVRRFALKPLSLALALSALAPMASADPFRNIQFTKNISIANMGGGLTHVYQNAKVGVIQTEGFGIGASEALRAFQPDTKSSLYINVTGAERSDILGSLSANGRVLISNANGIYFGAGAQINVGSLVATTLGINEADLWSGRIRLVDQGGQGAVVNAGTINATGTVALVGPQVTNEGSISAQRVGLAATSDVLVDVEGDGLIFFQMSGAKAGQRLSQLGEINADGGTVDMRASARGSMADTVLNLDGIVRARSLGAREGRVFIDGGAEGRTVVSGDIDVSGKGAGEQGGQATVLGQRVDVMSTASIDASGTQGGGTILVGGNYQGGGSERRAEVTVVETGARLDASAIKAGDGGQVVIWADDLTLFGGQIASRGGAEAGNGGSVEVSGKLRLGYQGYVDTSAAVGLRGHLLLDPKDVLISNSGGSISAANAANGSTDVVVNVAAINSANSDVTLTATGNMVVDAAINMTQSGVDLSLSAVNSLTVNQGISTNNGNITLTSYDGAALKPLTIKGSINAGNADVRLNGNVVLSGSSTGATTTTIAGGNIRINGDIDGDGVQTRSLVLDATQSVDISGVPPFTHDVGKNHAIGDLTVKAQTFKFDVNEVHSEAGSTATFVSRTSSQDIEVVSSGRGEDGRLRLSTGTLTKLGAFDNVVLGQGSGKTHFNVSTTYTLASNLIIKSAGSLDDDTTLNGGGHSLTVEAAFNGNNHSLTVSNVNLLTMEGSATNFVNLSLTATNIALENGITLEASGNQTLSGPITLANPVSGSQTYTFQANNLTINNGIAANDNSVTLRADSLALSGMVSSSGNAGTTVTIASDSNNRTIGLAGGTGNLAISQAELDAIAGFDQIVIGRTGTSGAITANAVTLGGNTTITSGTGNVTLNAITGGGATLAVNTAGTTTLNATPATLASLTTDAGGTTALNADLTTTGAATFNDSVILGGAAGSTRTLTGAEVRLNGGVVAGDHALVIRADEIAAGGTSTANTGVGVTLASQTTDRSIGLAGGTGDLDISQATLTALRNFSSITVGRSDSNSTITAGNLTLPTSLTLVSGTADATLGTVTSATAAALTVNSGGTTTFGGAVTGLASVTTDAAGTTAINADIATSGAQTYNDHVTLGGTGTRSFSASALVFAGNLATGGHSLSLLTDALTLAGTVTGGGTSALIATRTNGREIGLETATTGLALGQALLGKLSAYSSLTIGRADSNSTINTGALALGNNTTLITGGDVTLGQITGNGFSLAVNAAGVTTFGDTVSGVLNLGTDAAGSTRINADITTTGTQTYSDDVTLGGAGNRQLTGAEVRLLDGLAAGSHALTVRADEIVVSGTSTADAGVGVTLASLTDDRSIGLAGGAGDLDLTQATLTALRGFSSITVGRTGSNSTITAGTLQLPTSLTLQSGTAAVTLGAVGKLAGVTTAGLVINSGGVTTFGGAVSGITSLTTDAAGSTTVNADITTSGTQTYNDGVTLGGTGTRSFTGDTLVFQQDVQANALNVSLRADTLTFGAGADVVGSNAANQSITVAPLTASRTIGLAGGAGDVSIPITRITGFRQLVVGNSSGTGLITVGPGGGNLSLGFETLTLRTGSGNVLIQSTLSNPGLAFSVESTSGDVTFTADVGTPGNNLASLGVTTAGTTRFNGVSVHADNTTLDSNVVLAGDGLTTTFQGNNLVFKRAVDGVAAESHTLDTTGVNRTRFEGVVGQNAPLAVINTADVDLQASIRATTLNLGGDIRLLGDSSLTANNLTLGGSAGTSLDGGSGGSARDLALRSDTLVNNLTSIAGGDTLTLAPLSNDKDVRIGDSVVGTELLVSSTALEAFESFNLITVASTGTGEITVGNSTASLLTLPTSLRLETASGNITLLGRVVGAHSLTLDAGGTTQILSNLGGPLPGQALAGLTITGPVSIGDGPGIGTVSIQTSGAQDYQGNVTLGKDVTLSAGSVRFHGQVQASAPSDLTVNATGDARFDGAVGASSVQSLTVSAANIRLNGGSVTTTRAQRYTGTTVLGADTALTAGLGGVTLDGAVTGTSNGGQALTISAPQVSILQSVGTNATRLKSLQVNGPLTLAGAQVFTTGAQTYGGALVLQGNAVLTAGGNVTFGGAVDSDTSGIARDLTVNTNQFTRFQSSVGASRALGNLSTDMGGTTELQGNVSAAGTVSLGNDVILSGPGAAQTLTAGTLTFGGNLTVGAHDLVLVADTLTIAAGSNVTVDAGRAVSISTLTAGRSIGLAGGAGQLALSQTLLNKLGVFGSITIGRDGSNSDITANAVTLTSNTTLNSGTGTGVGAGNVSLAAVAGAGFNLSVNSAGTTAFNGAVNQVANLSTNAAGTTQVNSDISTTGAQNYQDAVALGGTGARLLSGTSLTFGSTLDAGARALNLRTDTLTIAGALTANGTATASIATLTSGKSIGLGSATGDLALDNTLLGKFAGFTSLTIGRADSNSQVNGTGLVLPTDLVIQTGIAGADLNGITGSGFDLNVASAGTSILRGSITGLTTLQTDADGRTELAGTVTTSGAQTYLDDVDVSGGATVASAGGAAIRFGGTVDGKTAGTGSLTANTAGETRFDGAVGQTRALGSLSTDAAGTTRLGANVRTAGAIAFQDAVTLTQSLTITHGGLTFGSTVDGSVDLTLAGSATTTFNGSVGATSRLNSLTTTGGGTVAVAAAVAGITTTGAQSYSGNLQLAGAKQLTATSLTVQGNLAAGGNLTLTTDDITLGGSLSGSGALVIAPLTASTTIAVGSGAGATGTLHVTQAMLDGSSGFSSLTIGRVDGTGAINVGEAELGTHTTVQSRTGEIRLNGPLDSAASGFFDINLNTGGTTTVLGAVGVTRAVRNFTTDDRSDVANFSESNGDGERTAFNAENTGGQAVIVARENITLNDPATSIVATRWQAGNTVTATSTGNRLGQTVSVSAATLNLFNSTNLALGDVTLNGSGQSSVITDGALSLRGNVALNAGTLLLQANVTPTTLADFTSDEFKGKVLTVGLVAALGEASNGIVQTDGNVTTAAGSLLVLRTPAGASITVNRAGNDIAGGISAVTGGIGENPETARLTTAVGDKVRAGFLRLQSRQLNVVGQPVGDADQTLLQAGLEGDVVELTADGINTAAGNGLIRARLPFDNNQGSLTAMPALTINVSAAGLNTPNAYGGVDKDGRVAVSLGSSVGGFVTVRPKNGAALGPGFVSLGGPEGLRPFYDGSGKVEEVPVFYNGDVPQTPQAVGALSAVTAVIEEARRARFEEAVRTENVSSRLRSGVYGEVGPGRPATEGSDTLKPPASCSPAAGSLTCQ